MATKRTLPRYSLVDTHSGESGWYHLIDPAISKTDPHFVKYPGATMPKGMFVQRGWSKKKTAEIVISVGEEGALVLRADVAKKVLAGTGLETRPIVLRMTNGARVDGWVMVVVDCWAPLDRSAGSASFIGTNDGRLGIAGALVALDWSAERTPRAPIFRLVEAPHVLVATADFMAKLRAVIKNGVHSGDPSRPQLFAPAWCAAKPFDVSTKTADAAEAAYWRLAGGLKSAGDRATACKHPLYAVAIALEVDRAPASDTRRAACAHPITSLQYAILVDKQPRDDTRAGADREAWCAYRYAYALDRAIPEAIAERAIAAEFQDAEGIAREREELAKLDPTAKPTAGPSPIKTVATRDLPSPPKKQPPRISVAKGERPDAEVCADIEEMTGRGLAQIEVTAAHGVPETIDALHAYVDRIRNGEVKLAKKAGAVRLMLACVFAEQLHRAFGWQWSNVRSDASTAVGVVSPDRAHAHNPLGLMNAIAKPKASRSNTIALFFNMLAAGKLPKGKRGSLTWVS